MAQIPSHKALTVSDGLNEFFNVDTITKQIQLANGASIIQYSDAYVTQTGSIVMSATTPDPGAAGTVATAGVGIALVTPVAARTGCILQAGTFNGQEVWVLNQGTAANSITWNTTPGTSNVADSATETAIAGLTARKYLWVAAASLWYPARD